MKGLPKELAHTVGAHIFAAGELIDVDPELAYKHAEAARRRAGRLPVVREAAAETAYAAGHFDVALREYRAIRRMSGGDELIPVIADCERALGKPREALETLASIKPQDAILRAECLLVEAGARDDLGQRDEGLRILKAAISEKMGSRESQARLRYAYANLLEESGKSEPAIHWFNDASGLDDSGDLNTADRIAALEGVTLPDSMDLEPDEPEEDGVSEDREHTGEESLDAVHSAEVESENKVDSVDDTEPGTSMEQSPISDAAVTEEDVSDRAQQSADTEGAEETSKDLE